MKWSNEERWDSIIETAAHEFGVPSNLIRAIIAQESGFVPNALRKETAIGDQSSGLMQILFSTAKGEGYTGVVGDPRMLSGLFDPATNIHYGTSYLASQFDRVGGNIAAAISAYNGGYRPSLGFGGVAPKPLTICLARDTAGKCINTRSVPTGQYSNQPYVNAVLSNFAYFQSKVAKAVPTAPVAVGIPAPPLTDADYREPEVNRPTSSTGFRALWNAIQETAMRILQWFYKKR